MGLFDFFKNNKSAKQRIPNNEMIIYYKNGLLKKIEQGNYRLNPNTTDYYSARYINSDGKIYDLENATDIENIATPIFDDFGKTSLGIKGNLAYVLRMKASSLKGKGKFENALVLLGKATEFMSASGVTWTRNDYMRYADWLYEMGYSGKADKFAAEVNSEFDNFNEAVNQVGFNNAKELGTDIVEASYIAACCPKCAKLRGRWFSISGKSKEFPKLPKDYNCTCGITFSPVILGIDIPVYCPKGTDIVAYSNRPFIDDRTEKEIADYEEFRFIEDTEKWYEPYRIRWLVLKGKKERQYFWLKENLPDLAPKSVAGYTRMKNLNSKNFNKLADTALSKGVNIRYTDDELAEIEFLNEKKERYNKAMALKNKRYNTN